MGTGVPPTTVGQAQKATCLPQPDPEIHGAFFRYWVDDRSFIRGAARLLAAPMEVPFPTMISDVIVLDHNGIPGTSAEQEINATATPTSGTWTIALNNEPTAPIAFDASAADVQAALEATSTVGAGNVTVTGGPLGTAPFVLDFSPGSLANTTVNLVAIDNTQLIGATATSSVTAFGGGDLGLYDAMPGWCDLGATKNGITISVNNAEETFDIDQQLGIIGSQPTSWTVTVATALAESTPERMQVAWEGSGITIDNTPASGPEEEMGIGAPYFYVQRRLAVLYQRPSRLIRGYFFRRAQRSPAEATITFAKTGDQQTIPVTWNVLPDNTEPNVLKQFFIIRDQAL